jgi:pimeloyl-ACP methyl ester carboxylesterase
MRAGPPGRLVDVGGHRLHLVCAGSGTPTVVFDAALGASSLSWSLVLPEVAKVTRACAYDRAGMGWSDAGPMPRTAGRIVAELHELLHRADLPPPYVLVGHSFGGLVARLFADRHRNETAGLVLIEPAHPEDWAEPGEAERKQIERGTRLCRYGAVAVRLGIGRTISTLVGLGAVGPARALVKLASRGGLSRDDEGIIAPMWKLPPEARRSLGHIWTQSKFYEALGSQIESICASAAELQQASASTLGDLPIVTISSAGATEGRLRREEALARLSSLGRHLIARNSGHWIPLDEPQVVIDAVAQMVATARLTVRDG